MKALQLTNYLNLIFNKNILKKIGIIFCLYFSILNTNGENNTIKHDTISEYDYWNYGMTFNIQVGAWIPIGNLKKTFKTNPSISFKISTPISKKLRIEFGSTINVPLNSEPFEYFDKEESFFVKSKNTINGTLGVWVSHENKLTKKYLLNKYFGIGVGFIQTDKKKLNSKKENDNWYSVETINFNFGFAFRKVAFKKRPIGIFIEYNFTPYQIFKNVKKDFGNSSLNTGISYRF